MFLVVFLSRLVSYPHLDMVLRHEQAVFKEMLAQRQPVKDQAPKVVCSHITSNQCKKKQTLHLCASTCHKIVRQHSQNDDTIWTREHKFGATSLPTPAPSVGPTTHSQYRKDEMDTAKCLVNAQFGICSKSANIRRICAETCFKYEKRSQGAPKNFFSFYAWVVSFLLLFLMFVSQAAFFRPCYVCCPDNCTYNTAIRSTHSATHAAQLR